MQKKFGGPWTETKLNCLKEYLKAYEFVMKKQPFFNLLYIDAFAGSGYREKDITDSSIRKFLKGSPHIALENTETFSKYIFIEKKIEIFQKLKKLERDFPSKAISCQNADANTYIKDLCKKIKWKNHRAVLFLDPFAMEAHWTALEAIAETKAIDIWILFPAMAVNRLLFKTKEIPSNMKKKLDMLFGTKKWKNNFYRESSQLQLFSNDTELEKIANFEGIKRFYLERLRTIFEGVADNPLPLKNLTGSTLFYLFFAVSNPRGKQPALRIAQHILGTN